MAAPRLDVPPEDEAPHPDSAWWGIHAARYTFATRRLGVGRVLDVACGTGYGMGILSVPGRKVVGADLDLEALRTANAVAPVVASDGGALPFPSAAFDMVTTFETMEHLEHRARFLEEVERVLAPGGTLILSTPNARYTRPVDGRPRNPYHVFEYTPEELRVEVEARFEDVSMLGQQMHPRFRISPFWDDQQRMPRSPRAQARLGVWRVLNKSPRPVRDAVSRRLWGHPLYPGADDYTFTADAVADAPVLVVTATRRRG